MTADLYSPTHGKLSLIPGWPADSRWPLLPQAQASCLQQSFGSIFLQEVYTGKYLFRLFIFQFLRQTTIEIKERGEGFQSLICLKGAVKHGMAKGEQHHLAAGQFTLLDAGKERTRLVVEGEQECRLFNTYYRCPELKIFLPYFPSLKADLVMAARYPRFLVSSPRAARYSILDSIQEVFYERFQPDLQNLYWDMKLRQNLLAHLAQAYTENEGRVSSPQEKLMAIAAQVLIEKDIRQHYSNEEIARRVNCSESSLKRAFRQEFGMGMYEYLRKLRMQRAKEMLLQGELVKNVGPAIGMRPTSFTAEFKKYFGYNATMLQRSRKQ